MSYFLVTGGGKLNGEVRVPGAKNAALPMLCAALLTRETCTFRNVPEISDIQVLLDVFEYIGAQTSWDKATKVVTVTAKDLNPKKLEHCEDLRKLRATILLLGPLLSRFGECKIVRPGGDIIGARPNFIHTDGFRSLGCDLLCENEYLHMVRREKEIKHKRLLLSEASVTGTENLLLFMASQNDETELYFAAAEPHVQALGHMLSQMGASVDGLGTHHLKIKGKKELKGVDVTLPPDGIIAGTYAVAGLITNSELLIKNVDHAELFSFYGVLKRIGADFEMIGKDLKVKPCLEKLKSIPKVQTAIYPGLSSDLQSIIGVLLTQCAGETVIFETLYEGRLTYLQELEKMGVKIEILSPHRAKIHGKASLRGAEVQSWDLRAGASMVLAGLVADGVTKVTNIVYIDRGYENFEATLRSIGAKVERVEA